MTNQRQYLAIEPDPKYLHNERDKECSSLLLP